MFFWGVFGCFLVFMFVFLVCLSFPDLVRGVFGLFFDVFFGVVSCLFDFLGRLIEDVVVMFGCFASMFLLVLSFLLLLGLLRGGKDMQKK